MKYSSHLKKSLLGFILLFLLSTLSLVAQGTVIESSIASKVLGKVVSYKIYLPSNYDQNVSQFPLLYLLHGHGGSEKDWFESKWGNMHHILDSLIEKKQIPPMVAVTFDAGNSWYVDRKEKMETFFMEEFVPFIETHYRVDPKLDPILAGDSMGGYGALRFSLLRPSKFGSVILLSPASYEPLPPSISSSRKVEAFTENGRFSEEKWQQYSYTHLWQNLINSAHKPTYYLSVGDDDPFNIVPVVTKLQQDMLKDNIPNELRITNGPHSWDVWRKNIIEALVHIYKDFIP